MSSLLVFDTETTGLTLHPSADPYKQPRLAEFAGAVLSLENGAVLDEVAFFVDPETPMPPEARKVNGITDEMLAGQPTFSGRYATLRHLFRSCESCVAHNLPFDRAILFAELQRLDVAPYSFPWPKPFCTMNIFTPTFGRAPTLRDVYKFVMGAELAQTHRALDDVRATVEIIQRAELWRIMK